IRAQHDSVRWPARAGFGIHRASKSVARPRDSPANCCCGRILRGRLAAALAAVGRSLRTGLRYTDADRSQILDFKVEVCPSGLRSTLGRRVYGKLYRGFESHSLRHPSLMNAREGCPMTVSHLQHVGEAILFGARRPTRIRWTPCLVRASSSSTTTSP